MALLALVLLQLIVESTAQAKSVTEKVRPYYPCESTATRIEFEGTTYLAKVLERKRVGTLRSPDESFKAWSVRRVLSPEGQTKHGQSTNANFDVNESRSITCSNLELEGRQGTKVVNLVERGPGDAPDSSSFKSVRVQGDQIVLTEDSLSRYDDQGTTFVTVYRFAPASPSSLIEISRSKSSPAKEAEDRAFHALKRSASAQDLRQAIRLIGRLEKAPSGWDPVSPKQFDRFAPLFIEKLKTIHAGQEPARKGSTSRLALKFVAAVLREEGEDPEQLDPRPDRLDEMLWYRAHEPGARDIQLWNDLAYYMNLEGQNEAGVEFLRWVIAHAPGRSVAHLNLAEALWHDEASRDEALQHLFVYRAQRQAFLGEKAVSLKPEFAKALNARLRQSSAEAGEGTDDGASAQDPSVFAADELRSWLGFEERAECLNFWGPELVPAEVTSWTEREQTSAPTSQKNRQAKASPSTFTVTRPVCVQGVPIDPKHPVSFLNGTLSSGTLARAHKFFVARCRAGSAFWTEPNRFRCELEGDQEVLGLPLLGGSTVDIGPQSRMEKFTLSKDARFSGYVLKARTPMTVIQLPSIVIAEPLRIDGFELPANTELKILGAEVLPAPSELKRYQVWLKLPVPTHIGGLTLQERARFKPGWVFDGKW